MPKPALRVPSAASSKEYRDGASSSEDDSHFDCTVCIDDVRTSVGESVGILIFFGMLMYHTSTLGDQLSHRVWPCHGCLRNLNIL
jgi:hypothetical protein